MDEKTARELLPIYSCDDSDVKTYRIGDAAGLHVSDWKKHGRRAKPKKTLEDRLICAIADAPKMLRDLVRDHLITMLVILALALEGWAVALVTERKVTKEVTETVTSELRAGFQQYLDQQERDRQAASFLTGEASFEAALDSDAEWGAKLIYGYLKNGNISRTQAKAIVCCAEARATSGYTGSFEEAVRQAKQWMWYSDDNPVRGEDKQLVKDVLRELRAGRYPDGFTSDYIYMEWNPGDIVLRNKWEKDSRTKYWRYPE